MTAAQKNNIQDLKKALLTEYACGALGENLSLLTAAMLTYCSESRCYVGLCEDLGGTLLDEECTPAAMNEGSLEAVLEALHKRGTENIHLPSQARRQSPPALKEAQNLPAPLAAHISGLARRLKWRTIAPGTKVCALPTADKGGALHLIHVAPGHKAPAHEHTGTEYTLVLEGAFHDEFGAYRKGEMIILEEGDEHHPAADAEMGCLCVVATEAPVRFTGKIMRLLNPLLGGL